MIARSPFNSLFFDPQRVVCSHMEQSPSYSWLLTLIAQQGSRHVTLRPVHAAEQGARRSRSDRPRRPCCIPRRLRQYQPTFKPRKSKTIVRNIGHSDDEIDMAGLTSLEGMEVDIIKPKAGSCGFFNGHVVFGSTTQFGLRHRPRPSRTSRSVDRFSLLGKDHTAEHEFITGKK